MRRNDRLWLPLVLLAGLAFYAFRLPIGVDLSDEAYYASHFVEWLRNGFAGSQNLNLQQLSELLVYPPARLYVALTGGLDGLMLFLRLLYAAMTLAAAGAVYALLRRLCPAAMAALGAALIIAFVPFGLPAPSYNTIALCGTTAGCCCFGLGLLRPATAIGGYRRQALLAAAAGLAALTALAYPTLAVSPPLLCACALAAGRERQDWRVVLSYAGWCVIAAALTSCILLAIFGAGHLVAMAEFTTASADLGGRLGAKIAASAAAIRREPLGMTALLLVCIGPLVLVRRTSARRRLRLAMLFVAAAALMLAAGPISFLKSHDMVLLAALFSPHVAWRAPQRRVAGALVVASLCLGLITLSTATNGLYNFFVGGMPAALLGLALLVPREEAAARPARSAAPFLQALPLLLATAAVGFSSSTFFYGEYAGALPTAPERVEGGAFAGLRTTAETKRFIAQTTALLQTSDRERFAVFGSSAGLYLLSDMRPWARSTYTIPEAMGARAFEQVQGLYRCVPPDVIAVTDLPATPPPAAGPLAAILRPYREQATVAIGWRTARFYRLPPADAAAPDRSGC